MPASHQLIEILQEARALLALPDNDFSWSGWEDQEHALREFDDLVSQLKTGDLSRLLDLRVLFAPTGPMQVVSLSSGWGDEFLPVAGRFDAALEEIAEQPN